MASGPNDRELQRYHDGELSARKARRVRAALEANPQAQARLTALEQMGSLMREAAEAAADEADFGRLWSGVQAGVAREETLPLGDRMRLWLRRWGLVMVASAAAAVVAVVLLLRPGADMSAPRNDAVIESLDVGAEAVGTIFTINDTGDSGQTTVIWVTETSVEGDD